MYGVKTTEYITPQKITVGLNKKYRAQKARDVPTISKQLFETMKFEKPDASDSFIAAKVFAKVHEIRNNKVETPDANETFKPDLSASAKTFRPRPKKSSRNTTFLRSTGS